MKIMNSYVSGLSHQTFWDFFPLALLTYPWLIALCVCVQGDDLNNPTFIIKGGNIFLKTQTRNFIFPLCLLAFYPSCGLCVCSSSLAGSRNLHTKCTGHVSRWVTKQHSIIPWGPSAPCVNCGHSRSYRWNLPYNLRGLLWILCFWIQRPFDYVII